MAENTTVNKVVINNETVIDITDTTATPDTVANGQVFYKASGERATGTMVETDPTVPSWAKQPTKPTYTASEVGALPDTTVIPSKTSDLTNDSGFLTSHQPVVQTLTSGTAIGSVGGTVLYAPATSTPEIFIGSTTPSGYTMWIDPEGMLVDANEVEY